jgi:hypothetical protein
MTRAVLVSVLALSLGACGGGDDPEPRPTPVPDAGGSLPPAFVECMADQGFSVDSPEEVHAAPQAVLQRCFGALHESGG